MNDNNQQREALRREALEHLSRLKATLQKLLEACTTQGDVEAVQDAMGYARDLQRCVDDVTGDDGEGPIIA